MRVKVKVCTLGVSLVLASIAVQADSTIKVNFPERPVAPRAEEECRSFESRVQTTTNELYAARQRIDDERAREALANNTVEDARNAENPGYHPAPHCDGGRTYNFRADAAYDDAICYANSLMNNGFSECMKEVSRSQEQTSASGDGSLYQTAVLAYSQESAKASIDVVDKAPKVYRGDGLISHWVAQASATKDYLDLAKDLRTVFDGNVPAKERLSAQNDLGLSLAQAMTENPLSQIFMASSVELIEDHYFKSMALLEAQMAAFDRTGKGAVLQPLDIRTLYDDEKLALIEKTVSTLDRLADLENSSANTYIGSEISYSARSSPTSNVNSSYVAAESNESVQPSGSALGAALAGATQGYLQMEQLKQQSRGTSSGRGGYSDLATSTCPAGYVVDWLQNPLSCPRGTEKMYLNSGSSCARCMSYASRPGSSK
jgi:hypothetical protein